VLSVTRFDVPAADAGTFVAELQGLLELLAARPGFQRGWVGRAADEPGLWLLATEWDSVGACRRSMSADVRMVAVPLLARGRDEPSAFEVLRAVDAGGSTASVSRRARDSDAVGLGEASGPAASDL
jgi:quinol monooxygenase YgiN